MSAIKNFLITFCISVLLFGLIAYLVVSYAVGNNMVPVIGGSNNLGSNIAEGNSDNAEPDDNTVSDDEEFGEALDVEVNTFTALLIGVDYQPNVFNDYDLSDVNKNIKGFPYKERKIMADSILMLHVNNKLKKFMISSIPSNMSVLVDGVETKLGSLYSDKGIQFMSDKVMSVTGMKIDYYAVITLDNFASIIEDIGGVTFDIPTDMVYEDPSQNLVINLSKGQHTLNGDKALKMIRYKSYSDGDVSRMIITVDFAKALLSKITSPDNFTKTLSLYKKYSENIETNFTETDLTANIESIVAYQQLETDVIIYPGSSNGEIFQPDINSAITTYKQYIK